MKMVHTGTVAIAVICFFICLGVHPSTAQVQVFFGDLAGFNTAAGSPPVVITFDDIAAGIDITGTMLAGVTFQLGSQPAPSAPLIVVPGLETFTPEEFEGVIDPTTNRLFPTSGEHVLSPGGLELGPGSDPLVENDDLELTFDPPVLSVGFDILFQSLDGAGFVNITVFGLDNEVLFSVSDVPIPGEEGGVGGDFFVGFVSQSANIAKIVIDELDDDNEFPDSNIGVDTFRIGHEPGPVPICTLTLTASVSEGPLTLAFTLGTPEPATWNVWLTAQNEITRLLSLPLSVTDPPVPVPFTIPFVPSLGTVGVLTTLTTPESGIICSDFATVDTGPVSEDVVSSVQELRDVLLQHLGP